MSKPPSRSPHSSHSDRPTPEDNAFYGKLARDRRRVFLVILPVSILLVILKHGGWNDPRAQIIEIIVISLMFMFMSLPLMWIRAHLRRDRNGKR